MGYFGYDAVRYIEPRLNNAPEADPVGLPDIWMMLSKTVIVFDNLKDTLFLIVHADVVDADAYNQAQQQLDALEDLLATPISLKATPHTAPHFESLTGKVKFLESIEKVKEYIRAGDVMQVVPGHRMVSDFDGEPLQVYRALRHLNPSPYLFLVQGQTLENNQPFHIVGSSRKFYRVLKMELQPCVRWQERDHVVKPKKRIWRLNKTCCRMKKRLLNI